MEKKKYTSPAIEVIVLKEAAGIMDNVLSGIDPGDGDNLIGGGEGGDLDAKENWGNLWEDEEE